MAEPSEPRPRRASLRGRGREILLGEPRREDPLHDELHAAEVMLEDADEDAGVAPALDVTGPAIEEAVAPPASSDEAMLPVVPVAVGAARWLADDDGPPLTGHTTQPATGAHVPDHPAEVPAPLGGADAMLPPPESEGPPGNWLPVPVAESGELPVLVDDEALRRLAAQIERLQDELAEADTLDPEAVTAWQRQLFEAGALLLASRANYETSRLIATGVQTEMNRQRRVRADVARYRPLLLNYILGWGIAWVVLMALKGAVVGIAEALNLTLVAAAYYPALFGVLGALLAAYLALERHAVRRRDFDPLHVTGYLISPLLGGAAGLLAFLALGLANHRVLDDSMTDMERVVVWVVCAVAGLNQSAILGRIGSLFRRERGD